MGRLEAATRLPADTRLLAELLAERLDLAVGHVRVELELDDGRLVSLWRHERIGARSLWKYDDRPTET